MDAKTDDSAGKCPFTGGTHGPKNRDWWPEHLDIGVLHTNAPAADPMGDAFNYAKEFESLDIDAVIKDLRAWVAGRLRSLWRAVHPHGVA
jgi:catalase-peroxidase